MKPDEERWLQERTYFDDEDYAEGPIPANTIERYMACRKPFLAPEYVFWVMGDVRNKRILEVGCGDGGRAVLLALKGASVVAIDISSRAILIAQNRARLHGVSDRTQFFALPVESYLAQARDRFDVICGFAILHHLLPALVGIIDELKTLSHEQTVFVFNEPVSLSPWLRRVRLAMPIAKRGTGGERPLEPSDLAVLQQRLPNLEIRLFGVLLRFWNRFIGGRYEDYSKVRMALFDALAMFDHALLSLPLCSGLASIAIMHSGPVRVR